jgi:hypothetical protein
VQQPRPCLVEAIIRRPAPAPWIVHALPEPENVPFWPGWLLDWRWTDKDKGLWMGLVRYTRDGLSYEHAVSGELLTVLPADTSTDDAQVVPDPVP